MPLRDWSWTERWHPVVLHLCIFGLMHPTRPPSQAIDSDFLVMPSKTQLVE